MRKRSRLKRNDPPPSTDERERAVDAADPTETAQAAGEDGMAETAATPGTAETGDSGGPGLSAEPVVPELSPTEQLEREIEELKDRYLRLAAEYDNYRKRTVRERAELRARLRAELVQLMLDAVDDLSRATNVAPGGASVEDVIAGVELVERKLMRELEGVGLVRVGAEGDLFDPNEHEAVGAELPPHPEEDGTIASVLQPGYKLGEILVRPARVRVYVAPHGGDAAASGGPAEASQR